jgi:hypothetical protein
MPLPAFPPQVPYQNHNDIVHTADHLRFEEGHPIFHPAGDGLLDLTPLASCHGHTSLLTHPLTDDSLTNRPLHQSPEASCPTPPNMSSFKVGGFRPIGQTRSAVRWVFPGDDDDRKDPEGRHTSPLLIPASHYRPPVPAPLIQNGQASFSSGDALHRSPYEPVPRSPYSTLGQHESTCYHDERRFLSHNRHEYPPPRDHDDARARRHDFSHVHGSEMTRPSRQGYFWQGLRGA